MSQDLYFRALNCYQQNKYEEALGLLHQCEQSMKVDALIKECTNALKMQYQYVINDAVNSDDWDTINNYIPKYKKNIGEDDFIQSIVAKRIEENAVVAEAKMHRGYIIGGCIFAAIIVILLVVRFVMPNSSNGSVNNDDAIDTTTVDQSTEYADDYDNIVNDDDYVGGDLPMFFISGPVKQIEERTSNGGNTVFTFDRHGKLMKYPEYPDMLRDEDGRITKVSCPEEFGESSIQFTYDSNGRLSSRLYLDTSTASETYSNFNEKGIPQSGTWGGEEVDGLSMQISCTEYDRHGNWTEMKVTKFEPNYTHETTYWRKISYYE